jgi:hypothetical protein
VDLKGERVYSALALILCRRIGAEREDWLGKDVRHLPGRFG